MGEKKTYSGLEIAVIGMSGRFPGAKDIEQFWKNLKSGVESITFFSEEELIEAGNEAELVKNPNYVKAFGALQDIEYFDSSFFGYTPNDAEVMDPQIRIFLECAWKALEDAGYCSELYDGLIGLYAGASPSVNWEAESFISGKSNRFGAEYFTNKDFLSLIISYKLNLYGPSVTLFTACSTSLAAIHMACQGILNGECDIALAGGIAIKHLNKKGYMYQEGMLNSPDGHCRAFDAKAKGAVSGEGVGIVVLKRYEEAVADGDTIHALIKGSAINNDGIRKVGLTAPSVEGQAEVIRTALHMAEVKPETVSYVETHGTGTILGDPIEIEALKLAFNSNNKKKFCAIGSVKTNIGHLDVAAGVAGFIKTILSLKHKLIPKSLHFETPNPKIDFENSPFYVNKELSEWSNDRYPLRAGVSSLGIGGTNVHVILEEAPEREDSSRSRPFQLLLFSAKTKPAMDRAVGNFIQYIKKNRHIKMADIAYTLQVGRKRLEYKKMLVCSNVNEAIEFLTGKSEHIRSHFLAKSEEPKPVIFMFPGQGAQYVNMGMGLYRTEHELRSELDHCFEILKPLVEYDIKKVLYTDLYSTGNPVGVNPNKINQTEITQPLLFIFEYALAKLLMKWGIKPDAMIGHSIGEYVAACLSGVFSLEDALKLVVLRGKLMQKMPPGAMLGVTMPEEELKPLLNNQLSLSAVNSPSLCVVSGTQESVNAFSGQLKEKGYKCTTIHTSHAFHSKMMEPILEEFEEKVKSIQLNKPVIPYISNVTGRYITNEEALTPEYWTKHIRRTVRFSYGVKELLKKESSIFIEVGPGTTLSTFVRKHSSKSKDQFIINLIRHPQENVPDEYLLLTKIGQLWLWGVEIDWSQYYLAERRYRISLPTYSFDRYYYWPNGDPFKMARRMILQKDSLTKRKDIADWFYIPLWKQSRSHITRLDEIPKGPNYLLFVDGCDFCSQLVKRFEQRGQNITVVKAGTEFKKSSEQDYQIDPGKSNDYELLFKELKQLERVPKIIVHLLNVTKGDPKDIDLKKVEKAQELGYYSLINIAQAIGQERISDKIQLKVISNNMQQVTGEEELCPEKSTLLGPIRVIPQEYSIGCNSIDIVLPGPGTREYEKLIDQLFIELITGSPDKIIAYRGLNRWVQIFEPVRVEKSIGVTKRLKEGGVYLIAGGLGGIGLVMAEYLAETVRAKLVLTSRSGLPEKDDWKEWLDTHDEANPISQKIRGVQKLINLGAEVMVLKADVSDLKRMQDVVSRVNNRFGPINGVITSAGIPDGALIQRRTREISERVFKSKVNGTLVLETIFKNKELDFFILCSSLASLFCRYGQVGYSAVNNFLDAFAHYKTTRDGVFTLSINWDTWQEVGMAVEAVKDRPDQKKELNDVIKPSEGKEVFGRLLDLSLPQVYVFTRDLYIMLEKFYSSDNKEEDISENASDKKALAVVHERPESSVTYVAPRSNLEEIIANTWKDILGLDRVGVNDNFFEIGGDSLKIVELNQKLKVALNKEIAVQTMFSYSTVNSLAKYLLEEEIDPNFSSKKIEQSKELDKAKNKMKQTIKKIKGGNK